MDRLFNLSRRSKVIVIVVLLVSATAFGYALWVTQNDKLASLYSNAVTAVTGIFVLSLIMILKERKDDIHEIQQSINLFLKKVIPVVINGRFIGEPIDSSLLDSRYALDIEIFHKEGEHHAAYRVTADVVHFEFTCLVNVYRISVFTFLPSEYDEGLITDVCENLINTGFKLSFEKIRRPNEPGHVVAILRKELIDHSADFVFSAREQHWIAGEIREWCRTVLRKLKYESDRITLLPIPFSDVAGHK